MKRCKICHVEAELEDGRCHSCRMAYEATEVYHMTYGKYAAMVSPPKDEPIGNSRQPEYKKCPWCGGEFIPVRSNQVYCCVTCSQSANYNQHREKVLEKAKVKTRPAPKNCAECGREYIPIRNDPRLKYCSSRCCSMANNRATVRRISEARRAKREQKRLLAEASTNAAELA